MARPYCAKCCLRNSMRILNLVMLLIGVGMITYSLWLEKKWCTALNSLPYSPSFPKPWFIYTCFGMGIAVCLSTVLGQMVANYVTKPTICLYITMVCCLLLFEVAVIIAIFFRMNWKATIASLIDEHHKEFETFVLFHVNACRVIMLLTLAAQMNIIILAAVLWAVGPDDPRAHYNEPQVTRFTQSFLVPAIPDVHVEMPPEACMRCESFIPVNQRRNFFENQRRNFSLYIKHLLIRLRLRRTDEVS